MQSPDGGIKLSADIRTQYPKVPIVFYSRKVTAEDALNCMKEDGIINVISKPTGKDDKDTEHKTIEMKDALVLRFGDMMDPEKAQLRFDIQKAVKLEWEGVKFFRQ